MKKPNRRSCFEAFVPCLAMLLASSSIVAAPAAKDIKAYRSSHEAAILDEFIDLLKIPNLASDSANIHRNAETVVEMMRRRGLSPQMLVPKATPDAPPLLYAEWR